MVKLAKDKRVTGLTLDAPMSGSLYKGDWFWPLNQNKWQGAVQVEGLYTGQDGSPAPKAPTIAIVDSGVAPVGDLGSRLLTQVNLDSRVTGESGDDFGHGDDGGGHRRWWLPRPSRSGSECRRCFAPNSEREQRVARLRRNRCLAVDPREQECVQHSCCQLLAPRVEPESSSFTTR